LVKNGTGGKQKREKIRFGLLNFFVLSPNLKGTVARNSDWLKVVSMEREKYQITADSF
jgi:hypothetical protein